MRKCVGILFCGLLFVGCATTKPPAPPPPKLIVTPDTAVMGQVIRVNENGRFAVLKFPVGTTPARDQRLGVFRRGLKVGEVKISGPQVEENTVGDIVNGDVQAGDELRGD